VAELQDAKQQYADQIAKVENEGKRYEQTIEESDVKGHEITAVTALIEEKARLAEEKGQMKKKCKEEKKRLDAELEKMKQKKSDLEQTEQT